MTDLKELEETIAVYGSEPDRWPDGQHVALAAVLQSTDGKILLREAGALEKVLDVAAGVETSGDTSALLAGIMSATVDAPSAGKSFEVIQSSRARRIGWMAGASMAAALLVGVFAGVNGFGAVVTPDGISLAQGEALYTADDALFADVMFSSDVDLEDDV